MSKIKLALEVVSDLRSLADSIEALFGAAEGNAPEAESKPEPEKAEQTEAKEKQPTLEEVRAKLAELSQSGKQSQVKKLISEFGAKKLSDIPEERYAQVLQKAEEL
ncbi:hypothetical protein EAL2_c19960 [Peptoclostridium acidaminophilum DSM 3953]|uniref:rRNA biogenesis protein rrp5 n=1 Tax=Peptoclostridium acidaminophilum DSM 3953 TaxID=1286171 RepID=W8TM49_PEPAC|nr:hypothetical protein [Peptoclostridium acidaminophilum]AHM57277.1 hypothetical protein EAL2_c19960 [Peptoclostridium acidaminophilum DSM 3953]